MMTTYCTKQKIAKSSTMAMLIIFTLFSSYAVNGMDYDSTSLLHHQEVRTNHHVINDDTDHSTEKRRMRRLQRKFKHNTKVGVDEVESNRRQLQSAPYFTTSALGDRNYNASYGNPLKGLGATQWSPEMQLDHAIEYTYAPLASVLKGFDTYDWSSFENTISGTVGRNRQLVPRFFITYPPYESSLPLTILRSIKLATYTEFGNDPNSGALPLSPVYNDTVLLGVLKNFITAFGAKYNGDKRLAYVQPGLLGFWGEYHTLGNPFIPQTSRDNVTTWFKQAFTKTPVMVRYPSAVTKALNVGYHDDSYTWSTLDGIYNAEPNRTRASFFWPSIVRAGHTDVWKFAPIGGEARPENIPWIMREGYVTAVNKQDFWECAKLTHTVYMKYGYFDGVGSFSHNKGKWISSTMGYNFQLRDVTASLNTATVPSTIDVSATVEQIGYTPFYYPLSLAFQCSGAILQTVPGVERLIDQFQKGIFTFRNIPINSACLSNVRFTLESQSLLATRPMKWAQGTTGIVTIGIPLPPGMSVPSAPVPSVIAAPVPMSVVVVVAPVPASVAVPVAPLPVPVAPLPVPVAPLPVPVTLAMPVAPVPTTIVVVVPPVPIPVASVPVFAPVPLPVLSGDFRYYLTTADSSTDKIIAQFVDNQVFSFASIGTRSLSVLVEAPSTTSRITFSWTDASGTTTRDEGSPPWLLGGNSGSDYTPVGSLSKTGTITITSNAKSSSGATFLTRSVRLVLVD